MSIPSPFGAAAFSCSYKDNVLLRHAEPHCMSSIETACEGNELQLQAWKYGNSGITAGGALDEIFFKYGSAIYIEPFDIPASWKTFASYDHGSSRPWAWLAWAESDGTDLLLRSGRTRSTRPGDL